MADYQLQTSTGEIIFEGSIEQIANILKVPKADVYDAKNTGKWIRQHKILSTKKKIMRSDIDEHLFKPDGSRKYEYKQGYPNRYKDSSCVRFTPL